MGPKPKDLSQRRKVPKARKEMKGVRASFSFSLRLSPGLREEALDFFTSSLGVSARSVSIEEEVHDSELGCYRHCSNSGYRPLDDFPADHQELYQGPSQRRRHF